MGGLTEREATTVAALFLGEIAFSIATGALARHGIHTLRQFAMMAVLLTMAGALPLFIVHPSLPLSSLMLC